MQNFVQESPKECIKDEIQTIVKIEENLELDDFISNSFNETDDKSIKSCQYDILDHMLEKSRYHRHRHFPLFTKS